MDAQAYVKEIAATARAAGALLAVAATVVTSAASR